MAVGLTRTSLWRMPAAAGLLGVAIGSLLMLSYPTITLRYRIVGVARRREICGLDLQGNEPQ